MAGRILLVEGDATIRKHLIALLRRLGFTCRSVGSVAAALDEARRQRYPLIIVDLDLTGRDPHGCAAHLRNAAPSARIVALDGNGDSPVDAFDAVVPKPFVAEPLLAALPTLLPTEP